MQMRHSLQGLQLTERFEDCKLAAYIPMKGDVPTIGYGHTRNVKLGDTCTKDQAVQWLLEDYDICERNVNTHVTVQISQHEFDALCDFEFNLGCNALNGSTMLKKLNAGDHKGAADEFEKWDHAGGKVVAGLLRRRLEEKAEFLTAD